MVLVAYPESEDSEDEKPQAPAKKDIPASSTKPDKFIVDKSNPRKIQVNLQEVNTEVTTNRDPDGEPASKRPRIGGGFSGFNSMLPAPKRDTQPANGTKTGANGTARRVFSLKTGAEPGFSRESDAELKELFAEQATNPLGAHMGGKTGDGNENSATDKSLTLSQPSANPLLGKGNAIMFKPLSVARNTKKKKPAPKSSASATTAQEQFSKPAPGPELQASAAAPKVKLFSMGNADVPSDAANIQQSEYEPLVYQGATEDGAFDRPSDETEVTTIALDTTTTTDTAEATTQSLDSIATDLNLSASAKRQLLGRNHKDASKISSSIINFNTDQEYAANEALRASSEQVPHNPVRAIAPGKHSLKQLVNAASGQKEALEESFASGRRNKKEAGGRYGW